MPHEINKLEFFTIAELIEEIGVSRQTLWRWRQEGLIPQGSRYRGRQVVFSAEEVAEIREYANRIEPIDESGSRQMSLFAGGGSR